MPTLPNMSLITPTLGGDSGTWDDKINACFALIDEHDHTPGKGVQVPVSGLNINADFAMGGYAVTGLGSIALNAVTALTTGSKRLFVNSADNELYWRTNSGTNVKLTAGTSINTTLVGGIVGDYSSVGALLAFDDANKRYTFKTQTSTWARLASGPVRIYEYNTSESVYVEHAVATALSGSYTITWPAALPSGAAFMQLDATGTVSFSNTLNGDQVRTIPASAFTQNESGGTKHAFSYHSWTIQATSGQNALIAPFQMAVGERIKTATIYISKDSADTTTISGYLFKINLATGSSSTVGTATNSGNATGAATLVIGSLTETIAAGYAYYVGVDQTTTSASRLYGASITYDRPAV